MKCAGRKRELWQLKKWRCDSGELQAGQLTSESIFSGASPGAGETENRDIFWPVLCQLCRYLSKFALYSWGVFCKEYLVTVQSIESKTSVVQLLRWQRYWCNGWLVAWNLKWALMDPWMISPLTYGVICVVGKCCAGAAYGITWAWFAHSSTCSFNLDGIAPCNILSLSVAWDFIFFPL